MVIEGGEGRNREAEGRRAGRPAGEPPPEWTNGSVLDASQPCLYRGDLPD